MTFAAMLSSQEPKLKKSKIQEMGNKTASSLESDTASNTSGFKSFPVPTSPFSSQRSLDDKQNSKNYSCSSKHGKSYKISRDRSSKVTKRILNDLDWPTIGKLPEAAGLINESLNSNPDVVGEPKIKKKRLMSGDEKLDEQSALEESPEENYSKMKPSKRRMTCQSDSDSPAPDGEEKQNHLTGSYDSSPDECNTDKTDKDSEKDVLKILPREVRGILVYQRGPIKSMKRVRFHDLKELTTIKYFRLDTDEHHNNNNINNNNNKSQSRVRMMECKKGKTTISSKVPHNSDSMWYTPFSKSLGNKGSFFPGHGSIEKDVQFNREKLILKVRYPNKESIPCSPSEPDKLAAAEVFEGKTPIDMDNLESDEVLDINDYSSENWPEPKENQIDMETDPAPNILLSNEKSVFFPPSNISNATEEANILIAQAEAIKTCKMPLSQSPMYANHFSTLGQNDFTNSALFVPPIPNSFQNVYNYGSNGYFCCGHQVSPGNFGPRNPMAPFNFVFCNPGPHANSGPLQPGPMFNPQGNYPRPIFPPSSRPCRYFSNGYCRNGDQCRFKH